MAERQWTTEQAQCIRARGGTLLVSAAAGSGKTAVLVQRILERITDERNPVDVDRLLVVTFTRAAASEMRQRLSGELTKLIARSPKDKRLQRQLLLLPKASITTVDGFCTELIRERAHVLGIPSDCRIAEETQASQLREEALAETLETCYAEGGSAFRLLADTLGTGRDDRAVSEAISQVFGFLQSHPFPELWMQRQAALYSADIPFPQTPWGQELRLYASQVLHGVSEYLQSAMQLCKEQEAFVVAYLPVLQTFYAETEKLRHSLSDLSWDALGDALSRLQCDKFSRAKGGDAILKKRISDLRDKAKKELEKLCRTFDRSEEECRADVRRSAPLIDTLFDAVRKFSARYSEKKQARRLLDFSDLEHLALALLIREENGVLRRTALADELSNRFEEILVDEYQDTNETQEALFSALSKEESNLFFVGDVKQSIYGFRQACPQLFLLRRDRCAPYDGVHYPAAVFLDRNFRSRREVTDGVNFLFRQLMTKEAGGIDYGVGEELVCGASYPEADSPSPYRTKLLVVDTEGVPKNDGGDKAEAGAIAREIRRIMQNVPVYDRDGNTLRPARYGDFCILLRSKQAHASAYVDELNRLGIPACSSGAGDFFATSEIALATSLLRVIDNPLQDVPLLSVLMSPLYAFTPDDMSEIRLTVPKKSLYTALQAYSRGDADGAPRAAAFLRQIARYRTLAATLPADRLLRRLYEESGLMDVASAQTHGQQRTANLQLLYELARSFEENGFCGLSAFIRHIDRLQKRGENVVAAANVSSAHADAVRIMSIHHSKGLEFPFVLLAGLSTAFNENSSRGNLLLQSDTGIGLRLLDARSLERQDTAMRKGVSLSIRRAEHTEQLRVLYVAATRAKEKLVLVTTLKNPISTLTSLAAPLSREGAIPAHTVLAARSFSDWILEVALRHPSAATLRRMAEAEDLPLFPTNDDWEIDIVRAQTDEEAPEAAEEDAFPIDMQEASALRERLQYTYPYATLGKVPNKLAASALSHGGRDLLLTATSQPAFLGSTGLSPTQRGTALHTFMQFADYHVAAKDVNAEIERLVERKFLTREQADSLSVVRLRRFFESPLYARMARSPRCLREVPFTIGRSVTALFPELATENAENEEIVVQGIADCVFEENGKLVVVDYKTDRVSSGEELCKRYEKQLHIYAHALSRALDLPVEKCILYAFALDEEVPVPLEKTQS